MKQPLSRSNSGFGAIAYILLAIVLIAAITGAIAVGTQSGGDLADIDRARQELYSQAQYVANVIRDCPASYGFRRSDASASRFIGFPESNTTATITNALSAEADAADLICPGNNDNPLFGAEWFFPKPIGGLETTQADRGAGWKYLRDDSAISISIRMSTLNDTNFANKVMAFTGGDNNPDGSAGPLGLTGRFALNESESCDSNGDSARDIFLLYITRAGALTAGNSHCRYW